MADVTTHGNSVRPDRMELLTTSDRIPDRVTRLERALASPRREGIGYMAGIHGSWSGDITAANCPFLFYDGVGTGYRLYCTPTVNCWWPVSGLVLVRVLDAAWLLMNVDLRLNPADANGYNVRTFTVQHHSGATPHVSAAINTMWALNAGVQYYCDLSAGYMSGGTWNWYYGGSQHTHILSPGITLR